MNPTLKDGRSRGGEALIKFVAPAQTMQPPPNLAKRMECVELAPAFLCGQYGRNGKSAGKPDALQTLREAPTPSN